MRRFFKSRTGSKGERERGFQCSPRPKRLNTVRSGFGCMAIANGIKKGDKVKVEYTGMLEDGSVFDSSEGKGPLEFVVGSDQLIKGFDTAVVGMKKGESKDVLVKPEEGYGQRNPALVTTIPREALPKEPEPQVGMVVKMQMKSGHRYRADIIKVEPDKVTVDMNHPLAGKNLKFKIKIVEIL